jgi:hypothetical protein
LSSILPKKGHGGNNLSESAGKNMLNKLGTFLLLFHEQKSIFCFNGVAL